MTACARPHRGPITLLAVLLASGCAIGPNYRRPTVDTPALFRGQDDRTDAPPAETAWWACFKDPELEELMASALAHGYDGKLAATRVEQARALFAQIHGQRLPSAGYEAAGDRGRNALLGNPYTEGAGSTASGFDGYLSAAWELDLWGRVRRLDEAARAQYLASEQARRGVVLSVEGVVATTYFELLELDEERAIAQEDTRSLGESLALFNQRLAGGVGSTLETASAEAAMANSRARLPALEEQITLRENLLSVLTGSPPGPIARGGRLGGHALPPPIPTGLPSQLLERRPDIRQAEEAVRAANAGIGVTEGGFLPRIGLSGLLGAVSPQLNGITSGQSGLWSVGAAASGPIFQGGGLRGQYAQSRTAWEEARLLYQQTALTAFAEVADALAERRQRAAVRVELERAVRAYADAVRISMERYAAGHAGYYEVLQAQQQLFPAEAALAQTRRDELIAVVQLYKALGGGWEP